uniref:protein Jade-1 n=1 Tax=Erigeron canadensis TaxID=72917 RepID=UPI001CB92FE9|nr:protein Jade-1 [Erigeron canadensis]
MENKIHSLPPHKRFNLLHQDPTPSCLPAKKRKESRNPLSISTNLDSLASLAATYCLPAKKRICALHPNHLPDKPFSLFDLNLEYDPKRETGQETGQESVDGQETEKNQDDEEDGILCAVCQSTDGDALDPIVFCDGCNLMVHTTCYGDPLTKGVPEGDWFCSQCRIITDKTKSLSCCLCPNNGGALKPTKDGRWAHIVCALFIPEVFFTDPEGREGIDCSKVLKKRWARKCYVCKEPKGCVIDCSEQKCGLSFHVTCGLEQNLCIEYKEGRNKGTIVAGFCKKHTDLWEKQQATGKYKIVARNEEE